MAKKKLKVDPATGMLPPENPIEVAEPGTSNETVNQRLMREFYEAQSEFYAARKKYYEAYEKVEKLIITGANVQTGKYQIDYGVRQVRRPRYKQVVIDLKGEAFQQQVLENTQPHAHFRVKVFF